MDAELTDRDSFPADGLTRHPRPTLAVDVVLLTVRRGSLHAVVLDQTDGSAVLPGGFVHAGESPEDTVKRVLREKAGLESVFVEQLYTFGRPARDRRAWVVTVAHYALVPQAALADLHTPARLAQVSIAWAGEAGGPGSVLDVAGRPVKLGYDHADILGLAVKRLRGKLWYAPVAFALLPDTFTLAEAQATYEAILGHELNTNAFRRRITANGLVESTGMRRPSAGVRSRPAGLFRLARASRVG